MPRRIIPTFIPIPPDRTTIWSCTIAGIDVSDYILNGKFPHGLISEELICEINLENSGEDFTDKFTFRDEIIFKMDFNDGSTIQFKGEIEEIKSKMDSSFKLQIKGAHFTAQLLDVIVTEEYTNSTVTNIRKDLIDKYLPGFTYNNIETNSTIIDIKFVKMPLLDCMIALDTQGDEDTYIDFNKDFHTFKRESKPNDSEWAVDEENMIELKGLGSDSAQVRNKVQVYGKTGELPVLYTSSDENSQTKYRTKESVITDTSITDESDAEDVADAENTQLKDPKAEGSAICYFQPNLNPGDMIYVISNIHNIHNRYRIVKFVYSIPDERTEDFFNKERSIPKLFKDRIKKDMAQEENVNPYKMLYSYNFTFDNENKIDKTSSSNYIVSEGNLYKGPGETGIMISDAKTTPITISSVHVLAKGTLLDGATYWVKANPNSQFQQISLDTLTNISSSDQGTELKLQIKITNANTRIDAVAVLYK